MDRIDEVKLKASLVEAIGNWLDGPAQEAHMPIVGDNLAEIMATAALSVLIGVADLYEYLQDAAMLKED